MAESKFKLKQIVKFKSGGPKMTIMDIITKGFPDGEELEDNEIEVKWFNSEGKLEEGTFDESDLVSCDDDE